GELLGAGESEAARPAQDHGPVVRGEGHRTPSLALIELLRSRSRALPCVSRTCSAERTSVIDWTETPIALKNPRSGRPGPISTTRPGRVVRASMLWRQRTVLLICRTSRVRSAASSASWKPPVRFEVTDAALAVSQRTLVVS